jgi:tRNA threonylcarbamoyladenosine biosynthesis protein TsaB
MILLALDTATPVTAVALLEDDKVLGQAYQPAKNHSVTLLPALDELLQKHNIGRKDLGGIVAGIGPGSFTGVRVGLTLAKSLAFALDIDLVGVSTLEALAQNGRGGEGDWICPCLDALKKEGYGAKYRTDGTCEQEASAHDPRRWAEDLADGGGRCLLMGTGVLRYREIFVEVLGERAIISDQDGDHRISAGEVGLLGLERLRRGEKDDPRTLEPMYCRLSEAELSRLGKR